MRFFILILPLFLCSCFDIKDSPKPDNKTMLKEKYVTLLFKCDGVRIYRFYDEGRFHYFSSKGECIDTLSYKSGKITHYYDENL